MQNTVVAWCGVYIGYKDHPLGSAHLISIHWHSLKIFLPVCSTLDLEAKKCEGRCPQCCLWQSELLNLFSHGEFCLHDGTNTKYSTQEIYQIDVLSYHYSLITSTECNIEWMSVFQCILNWLQCCSETVPDCSQTDEVCGTVVNILFSQFFAAAFRSWLAGCQMPGRCPSVAVCQLPLYITRDIACHIRWF